MSIIEAWGGFTGEFSDAEEPEEDDDEDEAGDPSQLCGGPGVGNEEWK